MHLRGVVYRNIQHLTSDLINTLPIRSEIMNKLNIKDLEVKEQLGYKDIVVKLYNVPVKYRCNRNIFGENLQGEVVWQVADVNPNLDAPFTHIMLFDNEKIKAYNWLGAYYYINILDGKIVLLPKLRLW